MVVHIPSYKKAINLMNQKIYHIDLGLRKHKDGDYEQKKSDVNVISDFGYNIIPKDVLNNPLVKNNGIYSGFIVGNQ